MYGSPLASDNDPGNHAKSNHPQKWQYTCLGKRYPVDLEDCFLIGIEARSTTGLCEEEVPALYLCPEYGTCKIFFVSLRVRQPYY